MAVLPVLTWGDPRLKKNSEDVGDWTPELDQLVADMFATALDEEGVGLAAPQVGVNLNLAVIDCSCGEDPAQQIILINPEITREEGSQIGPEGCLSIPGIREVLERPQKVTLRNRTKDHAQPRRHRRHPRAPISPPGVGSRRGSRSART